MSSNSIESKDHTEMLKIIKECLFDLRRLSVINVQGPSIFRYVDKVYQSAYDFARSIHLSPEFLQLLTDEDKNLIKEHFPTALPKLVHCIHGLANSIEFSLNTARTIRSKIWFIKNEIFDLYKQFNENNVSEEIENHFDELEWSNNILESKIFRWTEPDYEGAIDDPNEVPNLNGVPQSHYWWPEEYRQMWKNRN